MQTGTHIQARIYKLKKGEARRINLLQVNKSIQALSFYSE